MSFFSWLRSWGETYRPYEKTDAMVVAESLLMELDYQMKDAEHIMREKESRQRRQTGQVDYSWLISTQTKTYEMTQIERLELEELCMKVKPDECGTVITRFRETLVREPTVQEIPKLLRAVIMQVLQSRPKEETISEWVVRRTSSLTRFRPSPKVSPLSLAQLQAKENERRTQSLPVFWIQESRSDGLNPPV